MKTYILHQNYRSTKIILNAARSLVTKNKRQLKKELFTDNPEGDIIVTYEESGQVEEAERVRWLVNILANKRNIKYKDIAVLYRMSYLSRAIEEAFLKEGIPYRIIGGTPFYSRKEVKDILCFARLIFNPYDYEAFKRVINIPKRGIGEASVGKILDYARTRYSQSIDFIQAASEIELKGKAGEGLRQFNELMSELVSHSETDTAGEFISRILKETYYADMIYEDGVDAKADERYENIIELQHIAETFETLDEFLQNITLNTVDPDEDEENDNKVNLQTMHSAKGLEYEAVIISGSNEGICPHWKAVDPKSIDEERRLFYVAMTRAMKYLFITRPKSVIQQGRLMMQPKSRFFNEIDKQYLIDGRKIK